MNQEVELDDAARSVIAEGRFTLEPPDLSRARVRRAVESRLAAGADAAPARVLRHLTSVKVAAAVVAIAALATGALHKSGHHASALTQGSNPIANEVVPVVSVVAAPTSEAPPEPVAQPTVSPQTRPVPTPTNVTRTEQLAEEIKLLAGANAAINGRDASRATQLLREFDRRFSSPVLAEERAAAGVLALCASNRTAEAKSAGKQFLARWPRSPMLPRIAASCAATK